MTDRIPTVSASSASISPAIPISETAMGERPAGIRRIWTSPTLMTWLNTSARVISLTAVLPLVLRQFSAADIALYYLFSSIVALQLMVGSGFVPTFARFISYALAGAGEADFETARLASRMGSVKATANKKTFSRLVATLHAVFAWASVATLPVAGSLGAWFLRKPIGVSSDPGHAWIAWMMVAAVTPLTLYANQFSALLQGANKIALEQRWSAVFVIGGSIFGLGALLLGGGLLSLILASQLCQIASFFRLWWLAKSTLRSLPYDRKEACYSPRLFRAVWPSSWRSLLGVAASAGVTNLTGLVFAQRLAAAPLAEFLFGVRMMSIVSEVARAPFYSRIPVMNMLRARGDFASLAAVAQRGMRLAYATFALMISAGPVAAAFVLPLIGSHVAFPSVTFWLALSAATLIERWGAMHLQLYSTTNHIIWHWLNGVTGAVWIALMAISVARLGPFAYPLAMLVSYACIYTTVAVRKSVRSIHVSVWEFERRCALPALIGFVLIVVLIVTIHLRNPAFLP